ncbi:hypothetical protein DM02DRAFT_608019 [Periconia macrospinosa]|uniref:Uncharacterized protein n=1 Tax=Periconia macrospinosa TaxID=97972 RepID=A0A2V1EFW1_9PLEO|nr:hypothetical protein DM02DRAFT_608019 [Periconia macrospinosa]
MFCKPILALAAALPLVAFAADPTYTEKVGGYTFIKSGPKAENLAPKINYEWEAAQIALKLLKESLGPEGLLTTLAPAIAEADTYWKERVERSTGKLGQKEGWVSANGRAVVFLPNVTAERFVKWYLSPLADAFNNQANPEHYFKRTVVEGTSAVSDILEGWGGVTTHFGIPNFNLGINATRYPFIEPRGEGWIQATGDKALKSDGTVFGVLEIGVKNVKGADYEMPIDGVDISARVWYGDGVEDEHLEYERKHITNEIINSSLQTQKDIENGKLPV